jgi:hypothetical protein
MIGDRPWYFDLLMELDAEGWITANVEDYLGADETIGSERLLYLEYALELARSLQERTSYLGRSADERSAEFVEAWAADLNDPMNAERVFEEYEAWAKEWRPWEPALYRSEEDWRDEGLEEGHAALLARFDDLDPSSKPSTIVILPLLAYPAEADAIERALGTIQEDEARQRATIEKAASMLEKEGYDIGGIRQMDILGGLDNVSRLHDLHDLHEDLRLLIAEQIAPFDPDLAAHHERRRVGLVEQGPSADIGGLRIQITAIADNLHQRMAMMNDLLNTWRLKGIRFPHADGIRPSELLEWEANLPEIEATLSQHLAAFERWQSMANVWPDEAEKATPMAGLLEKTEAFIDFVDDLDQRWKRLELECIGRIEGFEHAGLTMDAWHEEVQADPRATLARLKQETGVLQQRVNLLEQLSLLDTSFEGAEDVAQRADLLRELDVGREVIEDTVRFIEHHARRGARHRRMLEHDWRDLVAQGKAGDSTATSAFSLAAFEKEIAHVRVYGTSIASTSTGASMIAGEVHERLKARLEQELVVLAAAGWSVEKLRGIALEDTVVASRKLNAARPYIEEHPRLVRRLTSLPWDRDIALALDIEASMRDPLKIGVLGDRVAGYAQHLAGRPSEDETFEITPWLPKPPRKTLLPVPEHGVRPTMVPVDALGDAHEAMLNAMEGSEEEDGVSRLHPLGVQPSIVRPNEVAAPKPALKPAPNPAPKPQPPVPSAPTPVQPAKESVKQPAKEVDQTAVAPKREVVSINEGIGASLASFLKAIDLDELSVRVEKEGADAIKDVRRRLAQHVGIEPRDTRIDRFLRLSLRLMPQGDDDDEMRAHLLGLLGENTTKIKRWMRTRLEHRHSGSSENFLDDAVRLGEALDRIPGPGFSIPLSADTKVLPNIADLPQLQNEVARIVAQMNPASAGGISA